MLLQMAPNLIFKLNDEEHFDVIIEESFDWVHCCYFAKMALCFDKKTYALGEDSVRYRIELLNTILNRVITGNYFLHPSIKQDIGYLYNEYLQNKSGLTYVKFEERDCWVGEQYYLWESGRQFAVWLYNASDGSIIFEVTPLYPYHFIEPEDITKFVPYDEWIKGYKPYVICIIPKEVAVQWLDQAESLLQTIAKNVERFKNEEERNQLH